MSVSFSHQLFLSRERLRADSVLLILLQLPEAFQFRLHTIHQLLVFAGNVIVLAREVFESLFLSRQLFLKQRFLIAPTDYCINTYAGIVFFLLLASLYSVISHTQLLVQARFLRLVLRLHFSQQLLLALSFGCQFHQILLDPRNMFTRISDRTVQFATQLLNLLLLIQQVMVAGYHLVSL